MKNNWIFFQAYGSYLCAQGMKQKLFQPTEKQPVNWKSKNLTRQFFPSVVFIAMKIASKASLFIADTKSNWLECFTDSVAFADFQVT